jgi:hypothetical protein
MAYLHRQPRQGTTRNTGYGNKPPPENSIKGFMSDEEYEEMKAAEQEAERRRHVTIEDEGDVSGHYVKTGDIIRKCIKGVCYVGTAAYIAHMMGLNPYAGGKTKRNKQRKRKKKTKRKRTSRRTV